jgi:four helix bundle protein
MKLTEAVYRLTHLLPPEEKSGLIVSLRRLATAIPTSIADGHGRRDRAAFSKAVGDAMASLRELHTQITVTERLHYLSWFRTSAMRRRIHRVHAMLEKLAQGLDHPIDNPIPITDAKSRKAA